MKAGVIQTQTRIIGERAFTLIELLVVISIIGMLASITLVSLSSARAKTKIAATTVFATNMYHAMGVNAFLFLNFEEGSGSTAYDSSYASNNGTLNSGATYSSDTYNKASSKYSMYFNGAGGAIALGKSFGITNKNFTIAQWIKTSRGTMQMYTMGNAGGGDGFRFGLSGGFISFLIGNGGYSEGSCGSVGNINNNEWHHIVGVYDRSSSLFDCYLDGKKIGSVVASIYPNMFDGPASIGKPICCYDFEGYLDDIIVYAQNLNGVAIKELYESQRGKYVTYNP